MRNPMNSSPNGNDGIGSILIAGLIIAVVAVALMMLTSLCARAEIRDTTNNDIKYSIINDFTGIKFFKSKAEVKKIIKKRNQKITQEKETYFHVNKGVLDGESYEYLFYGFDDKGLNGGSITYYCADSLHTERLFQKHLKEYNNKYGNYERLIDTVDKDNFCRILLWVQKPDQYYRIILITTNYKSHSTDKPFINVMIARVTEYMYKEIVKKMISNQN